MDKAIKIIFFWGLLFLIQVSRLFAWTLPLRHYSLDEGMPDTFIRCIYQDSMGYLWFGTRNGAVRFDGIDFKNYQVQDGLLGDYILDIFEDRSGYTWIGTNKGGVSCFRSGRIKKKYTGRHGLTGDGVSTITQDKEGFIWLGTLKGAFKFDGKKFINYTKKHGLASDSILRIICARDGSLWFGTANGVSRFSGGHFENYTTANKKAIKDASSLVEDSKGRIWIGSEINGLFVFEKGKFLSFTTADGLASNVVLSLMEDRSAGILVGTANGMSVFSRGKFTGCTTENGLLSNAILSLCQDREGNTWIGTNAGVSCLLSLKLENYSVKDGLRHNMVYTIIEDRAGRHWIGTENGLSCFSRGKFKTYTTGDGLMDNRVYELLEDSKGRIWIAGNGGLSVYSSGKFTYYTTKSGLLNNVVEALAEDRTGTIWIGTLSGLNWTMAGDNEGKISTFSFKDRKSGVRVRKILEDSKGNLWFSSPEGLFRVSPSREKITCFTDENGLPHNSPLPLVESSKGGLWIGTRGGLSCFKDGNFITYTTSDGLPHNKCYALVEDKGGNLWIGTGKGIVRFDGKTFQTYTREQGFPAENWVDAAFFRDSKGCLWLGSVNGFTRFWPETERSHAVPPPVYITGVEVMEADVPLSRTYRLEYHQNYLKFKYAGICLRSPGSVIYRHRLEGIDKDWLKTRDRLVSYHYLPPGRYRFRVKAINHEGMESPEPAEIRFHIRPPFWETWWFISLLVLVLLSVLGFIVVWRIRRMQEKMDYRARTRQLVMAQRMELLGILAAGAVHDLKNLLAVILGYSKMAEKSYQRLTGADDDKDTSRIPIEKIKKTAGTAIQVVKQILAFTRQKGDENVPVDLVDLLKDILDILNVTRPAAVKILWESSGEGVRYRINPARFQQLVMNLCINAIQAMPGGGELKISLAKIKPSTRMEQIRLEISDTGVGIKEEDLEKIFDPFYSTKEQEKGTGLGLFVVKQIIDDYKGKIDVHSKQGTGTRFIITFNPGI